MAENPTKQRKPSVGKGGVPTPAGFEKHPERRHNGAWKKDSTARFKLERMMELSPTEIEDVIADQNRPLFEIKLAQAIRGGRWKEIESMITQVYGQPKQTQDIKVQQVTPLVDIKQLKEG